MFLLTWGDVGTPSRQVEEVMESGDDSVRLGPHSRRDALVLAASARENLSLAENRFHSS